MRKIRRTVSLVVGATQCGIGAIIAAAAFLIYASEQMRDLLAVSSKEVHLYTFVLMIFSMISVLSGLLLVRRENDGK